MKKNSKKTKQVQKKQKSSGFKIASYIGVCTLVSVGLVTLVTLWRLSNVSLTLENNTPVTLPTIVPVQTSPPLPSSTNPPPVPSIAPTTPPPKPETSAAPVINQPEAFDIILPINAEILTPHSPDKLLYSKTMGDWRIHTGLDLAADTGTEVKAAAEGMVCKAYNDPLMGHTIILSHQSGYQTVYQNLSSTEMVTQGQTVAQGQVIAAVGDSAAAEMLEKAHLHFALKQEENFCNPLEYVNNNPNVTSSP